MALFFCQPLARDESDDSMSRRRELSAYISNQEVGLPSYFGGQVTEEEIHPVEGPEGPPFSQNNTTVELQRQFLALKRAGALPLQANLERRSLWSCALLTHRKLSFVFSLGASLPPFLPNQVTLQLHFRCSHELRTLSQKFHNNRTITIYQKCCILTRTSEWGVDEKRSLEKGVGRPI